MSTKAFDKLKAKLAELFQLDQADLDFGIYRIMNARRGEITTFLEKDLLPQVKTAFSEYKSSDKTELQKELAKVVEGIQAAGMNPDDSPKVMELRDQLANGAIDISAMEIDVYDHLHRFFARYYDEGDFISMRRYKEGVYAIPYEGEEVKLHWANADQYYIKTTENFRDYTFKAHDGSRVHFKLVEADTEKDNVKAPDNKQRRFVLAGEKPIAVENGELCISFEYRPESSKKKQDPINKLSVETIMSSLETQNSDWHEKLSAIWTRSNGTPSDKNLLEKHLNDYTKKNTFDYFIHKDLGKFLRRELDFYIKNEVMHLDDIEDAKAVKVEQYLSKIKVIRKIAHKIIEFLAQLENFQKKLWLKKKFVLETNYCITLDRVPEELYPQIATNKAQHDEWVKLFAINEITAEAGSLLDNASPAYSNPLTPEFLKANDKLVLDTKFFSQEFKEKLIASIDNFDEQCDGLLIHSENFQALNTLQDSYKGRVDCIHIDPPYNTATSGFLYKNTYQHSSWLTMMCDRSQIAKSIITEDGAFQCHIDENEYEALYQLFKTIGLPDSGTIVWDKRNPMNAGQGIARQHEYILWRSGKSSPIYLRNDSIIAMLSKAKNLIKDYGGVTEEVKKKYSDWVSSNTELTGGEKAYRYLDDEGKIYQSVSLRAPEPRQDPKFHQPLIHPVTKKPCPMPPNGFSRTPETLKQMMDEGLILFGTDETTQPRQKAILTEDKHRQLSSLIQDAKKGKSYTDKLGVNFPYCHPVSLYDLLIGAASSSKSIILDYFAGSGTTGHAVIDLNRNDEGSRKYILVEMGEHFENVLKPRIQKVVYSADWKAGKPTSRESGVSHCFKYVKLESYEDTLSNIQLKRKKYQQFALDQSDSFRESYMLGYMLEEESKNSPSVLNVSAFDDPFGYQLMVGTGSAGETRPVNVDLVETFNYLIGLKIKSMQTISGYRVVEGENLTGKKILVIWRKICDLNISDDEKIATRAKSNEELDKFFKKQQYNTLDMEFDLIYVNGDNNLMNIPVIPEGEGTQPSYKVRLIEEEFKKLMFDVEGM